MSTWKTLSFTTEAAPPTLWAAKYEATVRLTVEAAQLRLNDNVPTADLARVLSIPPAWTRESWNADETDLHRLALAKIKTLLDFDARLEGDSSQAIRGRLGKEFPAIAAEGANDAFDRPSLVGYKAFAVEALVRLDDGEAEWSVVVPGEGILPPGIRSADLESGASLKIFLQNIVRADVLERMGR